MFIVRQCKIAKYHVNSCTSTIYPILRHAARYPVLLLSFFSHHQANTYSYNMNSFVSIQISHMFALAFVFRSATWIPNCISPNDVCSSSSGGAPDASMHVTYILRYFSELQNNIVNKIYIVIYEEYMRWMFIGFIKYLAYINILLYVFISSSSELFMYRHKYIYNFKRCYNNIIFAASLKCCWLNFISIKERSCSLLLHKMHISMLMCLRWMCGSHRIYTMHTSAGLNDLTSLWNRGGIEATLRIRPSMSRASRKACHRTRAL